MDKVFEVLVWVDDNICHPVWDFLSLVFNKDNDKTMFFDRVFYAFCQFVCNGYDRTHS